MRRLLEAVAVVVIAAVFLYAMAGRVADAPYGYDESDYLFITPAGAAAHWIDSPSQTLPEFIRAGLSGGRDSAQRKRLSEEIRKAGYVDFYRHWHGPLYFYWLMVSTPSLPEDEHAVRMATVFFHGLTFVLIYFGVRAIRSLSAAILAAGAYLVSFSNFNASGQVVPHALFVLCYCAALLLLARMIETRDFRYWYAAIVATGLAFCTLEVALILIFTLIVSCWFERNRIFSGWQRPQWIRFALRSTGVFVATVLAAWPAGLLKLNFVKAYVIMAYLATFRKAAWGSESVLDSWMLRLRDSPAEWAVMIGGVAIYILWGRKQESGKSLAPMLIYSLLMLVAVGRVAAVEPAYLLPRYQAPYLASLLILGCLAATDLAARRGRAAQYGLTVALLILLGANAWRQYQKYPPVKDSPWKASVQQLRSAGLEGRVLLVPQNVLPVMRYYLRNLTCTGFLEDEDEMSLMDSMTAVNAAGLMRIEDPGRELPRRFGEAVVLARTGSGGRIVFYDRRSRTQ